jgi:uncharacterized protein DUF2845
LTESTGPRQKSELATLRALRSHAQAVVAKGSDMTNWQSMAGLWGIAALLVSGASQAEGLRCGENLASNGASLYEVRAKCGEPDDTQHSVETRTVQRKVLVPCANGRHLWEVIENQSVLVAIDRWTYDFGSNRFLAFAHFEQGNLVRVIQGPYGQKPPAP